MRTCMYDICGVKWRSGGASVRGSIALLAFRSSVNSASPLTLRLLPSRLHAASGNCDSVCVAACLEWQTRGASPVPDSATVGVHKVWNVLLVNLKREKLLSAAQNQAGRVRLTAAAAPHFGDFLDTVPCSSIGTRLDDTSLCIAVLLRLSAAMCAPHVRLRPAG